MKNKRMKIVLTVVLLLIVIFTSWKVWTNNSVNYQMNKLINGSPDQKARAADILTQKKVLNAIPLMVNSLNDISVTDINSKAPTYVYCVMLYNLDILTENNFGFCSNDVINNEEKRMIIINRWEKWYKNEYPQWLEENK